MKKRLALLLLVVISIASQAQTTLIPYRSGKLWGLADTSGVIKLMPSYDKLEYNWVRKAGTKEILPFFIVQKNKKYGLLTGTKILLAPTLNRLAVDSVFIREWKSVNGNPTVGGTREIVRNHKGISVLPDTIMQIQNVKVSKQPRELFYQTMGMRNSSGAFWYDDKAQTIKQWFIQNVAFVSMSEVRGRLLAVVLKTEKSPYSYFELIYNAALKKYDVKPLATYPKIEATDNEGPRHDSGYRNEKGNPLMLEKEFIRTSKGWSLITTSRRYAENGIKADTTVLKIKGDSITLADFSSGRFGKYHSTDNYWIRDKDTIFVYKNYLRFTYRGKTGAYLDERQIDPIYDDMIYFKSAIDSQPYFMVSKLSAGNKKLWGVVDQNGREILLVINDQIIRGRGANSNWVIKKDNLFGMTDNAGKILLPVQYDQIIPEESFLSFTIVKKGKYGLVSNSKDIIYPKFSVPIGFKIPMGNNYAVYQVKDDRDQVIGYADPKGFLYFKN